jgi:hypothetical protein
MIVFLYDDYGTTHLLQVRPIDSLSNVIYHEIFEWEHSWYYFHYDDADVINDTMIVVHTTYRIAVIYPDFNNQDSPSNREVKFYSKKILDQQE